MSKRNSDAVAEIKNKKARNEREIVDLVSEEEDEEEDSDSESEVYQDPVVEAYCKERKLARAKELRIAMVRKMFKDKGEEEEEEEDSEFEVYQDPVIAGDEGY